MPVPVKRPGTKLRTPEGVAEASPNHRAREGAEDTVSAVIIGGVSYPIPEKLSVREMYRIGYRTGRPYEEVRAGLAMTDANIVCEVLSVVLKRHGLNLTPEEIARKGPIKFVEDD